MFAPEGKGLGLVFALATMIMWGSWSTTLVVATRRMAFELYYLDWTLSFLLTGIAGGFLLGLLPGDNPSPGFAKAAFIDELFGHRFGTYMFSMLGGLLWSIANVTFCKAIELMGQALAFPLAVGLAMVTGSLTSYCVAPGNTSIALLLAGDFVALLGVCSVGLIARWKDAELGQKESRAAFTCEPSAEAHCDPSEEAHREPSMLRKFLLCIIAGLCNGLSNFGVINATTGSDAMSPPANQVFFSIAVFVSSAIMLPLFVALPLDGLPATTTTRAILATFKDVQLKDHLLALLGGAMLCSGFFFYNLAIDTALGAGPSFSIGQSAPLVGILWGTFLFKEFEGCSWRVKGIIPVTMCMFLAAIVLEAFAAST